MNQKLHPDSIRLMERMGWEHVGARHWAHPNWPMQDFDEKTALEMARDMFRKECAKV